VAAADIWTGLLLLATVTLIVRRILSFPTVTEQSIYGAISAYLIIGLMFATFYAAMAKMHGGYFFAAGRTGNARTFQYFSFTTLTTLGYGDFTAQYNSGQAIAVVEALTGQIFLATLIARLVAAFRGTDGPAQQLSPGPPDDVDDRDPDATVRAHRLPAGMRPGRRPHDPAGLAGRGWRRRPARRREG